MRLAVRWDPGREDDIFFHQSAVLGTGYHYLRIIIHRPFIPQARRLAVPPTALSSFEICVDSARQTVSIIYAHILRSGVLPLRSGVCFCPLRTQRSRSILTSTRDTAYFLLGGHHLAHVRLE